MVRSNVTVLKTTSLTNRILTWTSRCQHRDGFFLPWLLTLQSPNKFSLTAKEKPNWFHCCSNMINTEKDTFPPLYPESSIAFLIRSPKVLESACFADKHTAQSSCWCSTPSLTFVVLKLIKIKPAELSQVTTFIKFVQWEVKTYKEQDLTLSSTKFTVHVAISK